MLRLEGLLRDAEATRRPVIGICFGHQILAKALGGEVKAAPNGWQLGLTDYELIERPAWLEDAQDCFRLNAIHQDQVLRAPPGSSLLARATGCPIAALTYGNWAVSFQAHPEFTVPFEKILLTRLAGQILPDKLSCFALSALNQPNVNTDAVALAKGLQRFLRRR
jgi:GMP synthase (glutamine-hydrolysing)